MGVVASAALLFSAAPLAHDLIGTKVTWEREIAPIVEARCVSCHSDGGSAPMSLATYEEARPWARAIREEVLTRRMPKWHVVRGYGDFTNDPSLSPFEIALITAWVDGGAPAFAKASASADATADKPAGKPVHGAGLGESRQQPAHPAPTRAVTLPCSSTTLPAGEVLALRPELPAGGSLRITVTHPDGLQEPLLWVKEFEPEFAVTYWLRRRLRVRTGTAVQIDHSGTSNCSLGLAYTTRPPGVNKVIHK